MSITQTELQGSIVPFLTLLSPNVRLHSAVEKDAQELGFGELTYTVELKEGVADLKTLSCVARKRIKY